MTQRKKIEDPRSQREKFIDAAQEVGADADEAAFRRALKRVATAPREKPKKRARKSK